MNQLAEQLRELYASDLADEEKRREKERLFRETKQTFKESLPPSQEKRYARTLQIEWNNAFLVSHLTYHQDLSLMEEVYERFNGNLKAMIEWLKGMEKEKDPFDHVRSWLETEQNVEKL